MATLALNKMKSKLTTRNDFTGRAMDRMTKEKLHNLFNGDLNYLCWEETYLQRRFHPQQHLDKIRKQRKAIFEREKKHIDQSSESLINLTRILETEEKHDIEILDRFKRFLSKHTGSKPLLALDVDNTLIYVRFFSEELQIGDICTYFGDYSCVVQNNSKVLKIRLTLSLEITNNDLIDTLGCEIIDHLYWTASNDDIKRYTKRSTFEYPLNKNNSIDFIPCTIRKVLISGCIIAIYDDDDIREEIEIDFTQSNDNLNRFEPMLDRAGMLPVDFIYEGFLVRIRPNLDEFMEYINDDFDVCIYTSANKVIYEGLLAQLSIFVKERLGKDESEALWDHDILYRDDCILRYKLNGKPYHHKDLSLFGCDLSRVIMLDNSPIVCKGQEPNLILISDFFGKDEEDDELMEAYILLDAISCMKGDLRYFLCGLEDDKHLHESIDLSTKALCLHLTQQLIEAMKAYYNEEINIFAADDDNMMQDYGEDEIKKESLFARSLTCTPAQVEAILDDLQINEAGSINEEDTEKDETYIVLDDDDFKTENRDRNGSVFIPPKHSKKDSVVSVRDLRIIKKEKKEKLEQRSKISFDSQTDFRNKGRAMATPTRKRRTSSIINSMAPKPSSRAMLQSSCHQDFYLSFLQQMTYKEDEESVLTEKENEIRKLKNDIMELKISKEQKMKTIEMYTNNEKRNRSSIEAMQKEIKIYQKLEQMKDVNKGLNEELQQVNNKLSQMKTNKDDLQERINHVIETKIELIKTANAQIDHYRSLLRQIANKSVKISTQ